MKTSLPFRTICLAAALLVSSSPAADVVITNLISVSPTNRQFTLMWHGPASQVNGRLLVPEVMRGTTDYSGVFTFSNVSVGEYQLSLVGSMPQAIWLLSVPDTNGVLNAADLVQSTFLASDGFSRLYISAPGGSNLITYTNAGRIYLAGQPGGSGVGSGASATNPVFYGSLVTYPGTTVPGHVQMSGGAQGIKIYDPTDPSVIWYFNQSYGGKTVARLEDLQVLTLPGSSQTVYAQARSIAVGDGLQASDDGTHYTLSTTGASGTNGVSASTATNISAAVVARSNLLFSAPTKLVFVGDSITWLSWSYAYQLTNMYAFSNVVGFTNCGVNGRRLSALTNAFSDDIVGNRPGPGTNAICFVLIGANDYNNAASTTGFTNLTTATNWANTLEAYYAGILTNGYQLMAMTMTANGDVQNYGLSSIQGLQDYCNERIKRSPLPNWVVDPWDVCPNYTDGRFSYDRIHPTALTGSNLAAAVYSALCSRPNSRSVSGASGQLEWRRKVGIAGFGPAGLTNTFSAGTHSIGTNSGTPGMLTIVGDAQREMITLRAFKSGVEDGHFQFGFDSNALGYARFYLGMGSDSSFTVATQTFAYRIDVNSGSSWAANTFRTPFWTGGNVGKPILRSEQYYAGNTGDFFQGCLADGTTNVWIGYDGTVHAKIFIGDGSGLTNLTGSGLTAAQVGALILGSNQAPTMFSTSNTFVGVVNLSNRTDCSMVSGSRMAMYRAYFGESQVSGVGFWMDAATIPSFGIGYYDDASSFTLNTNLFAHKIDWNTAGLAANTFRIPYASTATTNKTVAEFFFNRSDDRGDLLAGTSYGGSSGNLFRIRYDGSASFAGTLDAPTLSIATLNVGDLNVTNPIPTSAGGTGQTNAGSAGQVLMSTGSTNSVWGPQPLASNQVAQTLSQSSLYTNLPIAGTGITFGTTNANGTWPINASATGSTPTARTAGGVMVADPVYGNAMWTYPMTSLLVQEPFLFGISRNNYQQSGSSGGTGAFKTRPATFTNAAEGAGYYRLSVTNNVGCYQYITWGSSGERNFCIGSNFFFSCRFAAESSGTGGTNFGFNCGWANAATTPYGTWLVGFACLPSSAGGTNVVMVVRTNSVAAFSNVCTFPLTTNKFIDLSVYGSTNGPIVFATNGVPAATNAAGAAVTLTGQAVFQPQFMLHSVQTNLANGTTNAASIRFINAYQGDQ
jgi:hypothetical protein